MIFKALVLLVVLSVIHQIDAYWTVIEKTSPRFGGFWAEVSEVYYDGNSTEILCTVDIQPAQDSHSITYEGHTAYVGCSGGSLVSLYGENRSLKYLRLLRSRTLLNCIATEHTTHYKEYICGNAVPNIVELPPVSHSYYPPSPSPSVQTCIWGYLGLREGQGPNGACCTHSDDCLDTCVYGICGLTP